MVDGLKELNGITEGERATLQRYIQQLLEEDTQKQIRLTASRVSFMYYMLWAYLIVQILRMIVDIATGLWP